MDNIQFHVIQTEKELDLFWQKWGRYMKEDIIPHAVPALSDEDIAYFFGGEYRDNIMQLFSRAVSPVRIAFIELNHAQIGFILYVLYSAEDGKCFILEFNIDPEYRNQGVGTNVFAAFKQTVSAEGAEYFALTASNEKNKRFWERQGFCLDGVDESNTPVLVLR